MANSTMIFCTSYCARESDFFRIKRWFKRVKSGPIDCDIVAIFDDSSPYLPSDLCDVFREVNFTTFDNFKSDKDFLFTFKNHFGRIDLHRFPGWTRSFYYAIRYAANNNIQKIIHLESDAAIISERMATYINEFSEDLWCGFWESSQYQMPETAVQVINGSAVSRAETFLREKFIDIITSEVDVENILPFDRIEKTFIGGRFPEMEKFVSGNLDFVSQLQFERENSYEWWASGYSDLKNRQLVYRLGDDDAPLAFVDGWGDQESSGRWGLCPHAVIRISEKILDGKHLILIYFNEIAKSKTGDIQILLSFKNMNGVVIESTQVPVVRNIISVDLPDFSGDINLFIYNPYSITPHQVSGYKSSDLRPLSIFVTEIEIYKRTN